MLTQQYHRLLLVLAVSSGCLTNAAAPVDPTTDAAAAETTTTTTNKPLRRYQTTSHQEKPLPNWRTLAAQHAATNRASDAVAALDDGEEFEEQIGVASGQWIYNKERQPNQSERRTAAAGHSGSSSGGAVRPLQPPFNDATEAPFAAQGSTSEPTAVQNFALNPITTQGKRTPQPTSSATTNLPTTAPKTNYPTTLAPSPAPTHAPTTARPVEPLQTYPPSRNPTPAPTSGATTSARPSRGQMMMMMMNSNRQTLAPTTPPPTPQPTLPFVPVGSPDLMTNAPTTTIVSSTLAPTNGPTPLPTNGPTLPPTNAPTLPPTNGPTLAPSTERPFETLDTNGQTPDLTLAPASMPPLPSVPVGIPATNTAAPTLAPTFAPVPLPTNPPTLPPVAIPTRPLETPRPTLPGVTFEPTVMATLPFIPGLPFEAYLEAQTMPPTSSATGTEAPVSTTTLPTAVILSGSPAELQFPTESLELQTATPTELSAEATILPSEFMVSATSAPTESAMLAEDSCYYSWIYCGAAMSTCFDTYPGVTAPNEGSGWIINLTDYDFDASDPLQCEVWGGAKSCDTSQGELLGVAAIDSNAVTWYIKQGYASMGFQLYTGQCVMNDNGGSWSNDMECGSFEYSPYDVFNYPLSTTLPVKPPTDRWKYDFNNKQTFTTAAWTFGSQTYQAFPLDSYSPLYMSGHAQICAYTADQPASTQFTEAGCEHPMPTTVGTPTTPMTSPTMPPTTGSSPSASPTRPSSPTKPRTNSPTNMPTAKPSGRPTPRPSPSPTARPSAKPTLAMTSAPSALLATKAPAPFLAPAESLPPSECVCVCPTTAPTAIFIEPGSPEPTVSPTRAPSQMPTASPTLASTTAPSAALSTINPTLTNVAESVKPTSPPTTAAPVTEAPASAAPSQMPTVSPVVASTTAPSAALSTINPTLTNVAESGKPTSTPTTASPVTKAPASAAPTPVPSQKPTVSPTVASTTAPSAALSTINPTLTNLAESTKPTTASPVTEAPVSTAPVSASPVSSAPVSAAPTSPFDGLGDPEVTSAPTISLPDATLAPSSATKCIDAYVSCPGRSTCFLSPKFNCHAGVDGEDPWGWNIEYNNADGVVTDCEVFANANSCSSGERIGTATITPDTFTISLDATYTSQDYTFEFNFYAGECLGSDAGNHLESGVCLADDVATYAPDSDSYPFTSGQVSVNYATFDNSSVVVPGSSWSGVNYQVFPLGSDTTKYLTGHVQICSV